MAREVWQEYITKQKPPALAGAVFTESAFNPLSRLGSDCQAKVHKMNYDKIADSLWALDPNTIHLNHGSFGACPRPVLERQTELRMEMESNLTRFMVRRLPGLLEPVREELAAFVGASPLDLVFVRNATSGVNTVLKSLDLHPGDELLVTNMAYGASRNALDFVAGQSRARVEVAMIPFPIQNEDQILQALLSKVTSKTRFLLIDHITSTTGLVMPIQGIVGAMHERGIETLVDGAHGPGLVELELDKLGALAYTGNCHKWLCTPKGSALLWVRRDWQDRIRPTSISHGASTRPEAHRSRFLEEFDWTGTDDPTPWLCIPEGITLLRGLFPGGFAELRAHQNSLVLYGRQQLCDRLGSASPAPESMIAALATVPLPDADSDAPFSMADPDPLLRDLHRRHFEAVVVPWPAPPKRVLRISAHVYNDRRHYQALAEAVGNFFEA